MLQVVLLGREMLRDFEYRQMHVPEIQFYAAFFRESERIFNG